MHGRGRKGMQSSRDRVLTDGKPVRLQKAGGSPTSDPAEGEFLRRCKLNTNSYPPGGGASGRQRLPEADL